MAYLSQPELVEATTEHGQKVEASVAGGSWNVVNKGTRQLAMNLKLQPPPIDATMLKRLHLRWPVIAVGDMQNLEIPDLTEGKQYFQDDAEVTVEDVVEKPADRYEIVISVLRDLRIPHVKEILGIENDIVIYDAAGNELKEVSRTNSISDDGFAFHRITVTPEKGQKEPSRASVGYPRYRDSRGVDVIFENVRLPVRKPE